MASKKILIANDETMIRDLIKDSLEDEGYELFEADNGDDALNLAMKIKPDLMLLDILMPKMVGYTVCSTLKENPATKDTYIMFITGRDSSAVNLTVSMVHGDEIISKPFDPLELRQKIRTALERKIK